MTRSISKRECNFKMTPAEFHFDGWDSKGLLMIQGIWWFIGSCLLFLLLWLWHYTLVESSYLIWTPLPAISLNSLTFNHLSQSVMPLILWKHILWWLWMEWCIVIIMCLVFIISNAIILWKVNKRGRLSRTQIKKIISVNKLIWSILFPFFVTCILNKFSYQ